MAEYNEEEWRLTLLRFIHSYFLKQILEEIGEKPTKENKEMIKGSLKRRLMIDSLGKLTARELRVFISNSAMILSRDCDIEVNEIGDPIENNSDTSLQDFFHLVYSKQN